ncbi:MAG: GlxA family transcriptional regulator [Gammaproteobacteria bacterium]|nr:GlxA family transcriptional regulator [Gammaproteobacteria bacterium]
MSTAKNCNKPTINFIFLVLPEFSLIAYAAAVDTLRLANRVSEKKLYTWQTITPSSKTVQASNGLSIKPDKIFTGKESCNIFFVCGGVKIKNSWSKSLGTRLRSIDKSGIAIGSLCTGTFILAKAGLLDGYRCTIHWENLSSTREKFPHLNLTDDIYEIDRNRYTCAGGITAIDMIHHIISLQYGRDIAASIIESFVVGQVRSMSDRQRIPLRQQIGTAQPKLIEAVKLMESNIEELLKPSEIAKLVGISRRQLERLFNNHLDSTPTRYYLGLRLKNARRLLLQSELPIIEISLICGFSSAPHFSKCYRDLFGRSPSNERLLLLEQIDEVI